MMGLKQLLLLLSFHISWQLLYNKGVELQQHNNTNWGELLFCHFAVPNSYCFGFGYFFRHGSSYNYYRLHQTPEGYISKDIYILSKNLQKGYFLSFFGAGYFEDIISYF
jgi:hypothetical protein